MHQRLFLIIHMHSSGDKQTQPFWVPFGSLNIRFKIGRRPVADIWTHKLKHQHTKEFSIKDRQRNDYKQSKTFFWQSAGERCLTQLCDVFTQSVSFTSIQTRTFGLLLLTHPNKFPFLLAKGVISKALVGWFSRALTCFARYTIHEKKYSAIARRKIYLF